MQMSGMSIECLSHSIEEELQKLNTSVQPALHRLIYKVPANLRALDVKAYEPKAFSFGPYHHGKETLQEMESMKWNILNCTLCKNPARRIKDYVSAIREMETQVSSCYSDQHQISQMGSDEFVKMLLLDSCFLLRVVLDSVAEHPPPIQHYEPKDPSWLSAFLLHDMFLLENQIPFFVLERTYELSHTTPQNAHIETPLKVKMKEAFNKLFLKMYTDVSPDVDSFEADHLLHFCWYIMCSTFRDQATQPHKLKQYGTSNPITVPNPGTYPIHEPIRLPTAVELWEAGIQFKEGSKTRLLDIKFTKMVGTLEIPRLYIDDNTNSLFRNLIAYEQSFSEQDFSSYVQFISYLVGRTSDVELLRRKKIIDSHMRSDSEVCDVLSNLTVQISLRSEDSYLKPVFESVNISAKAKLNKWEAWLRHKYNNPWLILSLFAAIIVLVCTILQAIYAVKGNNCDCATTNPN